MPFGSLVHFWTQFGVLGKVRKLFLSLREMILAPNQMWRLSALSTAC